jgi:hydroxylamine reductase
MFCYQCEQTAKGEGCFKSGVCGKQPEVAALQDLLTHSLIGLSLAAVEGRKSGINDRNINVFSCEALFATLTNVNFDQARFIALLLQCLKYRDALIDKIKAAGGKIDLSQDYLLFKSSDTIEKLVALGEKVGLKSYPAPNADILSLKHILLFGIRGTAAYVDHARILGKEDDAVYAFIHEGLAALANEKINLD